MRTLQYLNATLWLANAVTWLFYTQVWPMAMLSAIAAGAAVVVGRNSDTWRY